MEKCLHAAGLGPGSYFPWMYILFWVSIPLFQKINSKCGNLFLSFLAFSGLCASLEYTFYLLSTQIDYSAASQIWRIPPLRYLMIIYAGLNFHHLEKLTLVNLSLFFVCGTLAWIDIFTSPISNSYGWLGYHWFTVLYVVPIILILRKIGHGILSILGRYSYEIFLVQIMVFYVVDTFGIGRYPTYWIAFRIIELILIAFFSITTIKLKKIYYYESSKNHSRNRL